MKIKYLFLTVTLFAVCAFPILTPTHVYAEEIVSDAQLTMGSVKIFVNGKRVRKQTLLYNDSTYLPLRALAESLGKEILYDPITVTAQINSTAVDYPPNDDAGDIDTVQTITSAIYLGRTKLMVDGINVPQETLLYNDSAYAPLRAVAELLNMEVAYDPDTKSAMLSDKVGRTLVYYENFPTVIDLGAYAEIPADSVKISVEAESTKFLYLGVSDTSVAEYVAEIIKEGFVRDLTQANPNIYVCTKDKITVTIDNDTYKSTGLLLVSIVETEPFSYPQEFPAVPLFSPEKPAQTAMTTDNRGIIYTYAGISDEKLTAYFAELTRLGYVHNTSLSAENYNVYNLDEISVTVDAVNLKTENRMMVTIKNEIFLFQKEFPTIPTFSRVKPENTTPSEDGKGSVYWYKGATDDIIDEYIKELSRIGYITDASLSKAGYYVYKQNDVTVCIDTLTYRSTGYVLLTVTKEITVVYYPNYPTVPSFPARIETTSDTDDYKGKIYWHLNVSEASVNEYAELLVRLSFVKDSANSREGYQIYTKADISVTLDSITRSSNGFFLLSIKQIDPSSSVNNNFLAYRSYPTVPDIGAFSSPYAQPVQTMMENDNIEVYFYSKLTNEAVQNYLKYLIDNKYTNVSAESRDGYWVFQKDELILTVDTTTQANTYTIVKINTTFVIKYYQDMPIVPDFATVVKKQWTVPSDRLSVSDGYYYRIKEGNSEAATGYTGEASLFSVYTQYLETTGFVLDQAQPAPVEGETRRDIAYVKSGVKILVTELVESQDSGEYVITIIVKRIG